MKHAHKCYKGLLFQIIGDHCFRKRLSIEAPFHLLRIGIDCNSHCAYCAFVCWRSDSSPWSTFLIHHAVCIMQSTTAKMEAYRFVADLVSQGDKAPGHYPEFYAIFGRRNHFELKLVLALIRENMWFETVPDPIFLEFGDLVALDLIQLEERVQLLVVFNDRYYWCYSDVLFMRGALFLLVWKFNGL